MRPSSTVFNVSTEGWPTTTPSISGCASSISSAPVAVSGRSSGRAPSWTTTISRVARDRASPEATDSWRVRPLGANTTGVVKPERADRPVAILVEPIGVAHEHDRAQTARLRAPRATRRQPAAPQPRRAACLPSRPKRSPLPPATTIAAVTASLTRTPRRLRARAGRAKIMRPAEVCRTDVTSTSASVPTSPRPSCTTTIVPSSRYPTPWPGSLPAFATCRWMSSPGRKLGRSDAAASLRLSTSIALTSRHLAQVVVDRHQHRRSNRWPAASASRRPRRYQGSPPRRCRPRLLSGSVASRSRPRRPRMRLPSSAESARVCSSARTKRGTRMRPGMKPSSCIC